MTDEKTKLSFRDALALLGYGFKLVARLTPAYLPYMLCRALITAAQPLAVLFFSARILNELSGVQDLRMITIYAATAVGLSFLLSVLKALLTREIETLSGWERAYHRMQMMEAEQFTRMDYVHAEDSRVSEILARMDTQAMGNGLGLMNMFYLPATAAENLFSLALSVLLLHGGLSAGNGISMGAFPALALYGLLVIGLLLTLRYRSREKTILEKVYAENAKANTAAGFYHTYIKSDQAAKDVRLYDQAGALQRIFSESFSMKSWLSYFFFSGRLNGFSLGVLSVISGGFYLLTGYNALGGGAVGNIVQSVGAITALSSAIGSLVSVGGQLYNNATFLKPMQEFLSLPDVLVKGTRPVPAPQGHVYQFEFRNVSFQYPGAKTYALKDLNLKLNAGQRLAVVGCNGSGKTTMIKLLCRLYDPTGGEILLDGVNIKEYDYEQYIGLFSVVFQDYMLFPLWLGQNVATGMDYDAACVKACLDSAGFGERLQAMSEGLDTILYKSFDEDGTQVSGGEAQKIALARALYKDAPLVVLDEPTAALDPIAEYEVYTRFDETIGGKTAVFISHRLSSCRFCHDIAVFDDGRLVQRGSHDALLSCEDGKYYELWNAQAAHYTE